MKTTRLPKKEYENQLAQRKSNRSCHKKKNGLPRPKLVCSRDRNGNVFCAGCEILIIPQNATDDEFGMLRDKFEMAGGVSNCCYDCEFKWYCNGCCFTMIYETCTFRTCGSTVMAQLLDPDHGGGRYSNTKKEHYWTYLRQFFSQEIKHNHENPLMGKIADLNKIIEIYEGPDIEKELIQYKNGMKNKISSRTIFPNKFIV